MISVLTRFFQTCNRFSVQIKSSLPPRDTSISELQELTVTPRHSSDIAITTESECNTPSAHRKLLPNLFEGKHKLHSMLTLNFKLPEAEG